MNPSLKITLGAALSSFFGFALFSNSCPSGDISAAVPNTPAPNTPVAAAPAAAPVPAATAAAVTECQSDINAVMTGKTVNFKSGSAYLAADSNALLDDVAKVLKPCAGTSVEIQGHTDLVGGADTNLILSQSRADTVKKALVSRGLVADTLSAKGYGATQPLENVINPAANAKNRRTIFAISAAGAKPATTSAATPQGTQ
jgi:outer membrane protein OmpA-like peptidoglycan-associated protein